MAKKTERVCIHCGEVVKGNEEICPYCGLSVGSTASNDDKFIENDKESNAKNNQKQSKKTSTKMNDDKSKLILSGGLIALLLVAVVVAIFLTKKKPVEIDNKIKGTITTKEELNKKFDVDIKEPVEANEINYVMEDDNIAKLVYKKTVTDGVVMDFVLRIASSTEDIEKSIGLTDSKGVDVEFAYTPIMMTVICEDGSEVPVESKVALDDNNGEMRYMRALWYDNDKYYSMVTDNLYTREDFLQEVNRVIIANHLMDDFVDEFVEDDIATKSDITIDLEEETKDRKEIEIEAEK